MIHVNVKWGREVFRDVELDTDESPLEFKVRLFSLTGVQPDRQKLMTSGKMIGDTWGDKAQLKDGATFMLMGSTKDIPVLKSAPQSPTSTLLSLFEQRKVKTGESSYHLLRSRMYLTAGLRNMGATCYLNAVLQALFAATEFRKELEKLPVREDSANAELYKALLDVWKQIETSKTPVRPTSLLELLRTSYPDFAQTDNMGLNVQQDANECLQVLLRVIGESCRLEINNENKNIVDQVFGIDFNVRYKNLECQQEPEARTTEHHRQLSCFITQEVKYMFSGIQLRFKDTIKKFSRGLNCNATFLKTMAITRLPKYLSIVFVRFYYKGRERINAKILKDIKFPMKLDLVDLCDPDLTPKLTTMRDKIRIYDDYVTKTNGETHKREEEMTEEDFEAMEVEPTNFPEDVGSNNSAMYELISVVTHKGRSSGTGHYVAWVNNSPPCRPPIWRQYDDDTVTEVTEKQVMELSGGGDWHTAYILLYRSRTVPTKAVEDIDFAALNE